MNRPVLSRPANAARLEVGWRLIAQFQFLDAILAADEVFVSVATVWAIAIKHALGKGDMPVASGQALQAFRDAGYALLDVEPEHAVRVQDLPPIHKDPFDRLLVAQALIEPLTLLTGDPLVTRYSEGIVQV